MWTEYYKLCWRPGPRRSQSDTVEDDRRIGDRQHVRGGQCGNASGRATIRAVSVALGGVSWGLGVLEVGHAIALGLRAR